MDQSFSPKNLRLIWDLDARRGRERLDLYPDLRRAYDAARDARQRARAHRNGTIAYIGPPNKAPEQVSHKKRKKAEKILTRSLSSTSEILIDSVENDTFSWDLQNGCTVGQNRKTYIVADTPETFFADKHLQRVVSSILWGRPPGRQSIVAGLVKTLDNNLPKIVIRVDVASFYENVDHRRLRDLLSGTAMSPSCQRMIDKLLDEMAALTGKAVGLPAGVGVSAKLAEFYIAQADRALRDAPGTLYFARYVDDIILVKGQEKTGAISAGDVISSIEDQLGQLYLRLNGSKTKSVELVNNSLKKFNFLGYEFEYRGKQGMFVRLTKGRYATIRRRVDKTFDAWDKAHIDNHGRRSLLLDRLRLLTGNTRLSHNKRNAMVGIYFSNPHLTDLANLRTLDAHLQRRASMSTLPTGLEDRVKDLSFEKGFTDRIVHRWSMQRLKGLKGAWLA